MSSIFGLRSSYMLEYRWLFALLLRETFFTVTVFCDIPPLGCNHINVHLKNHNFVTPVSTFAKSPAFTALMEQLILRKLQ